MSAVETPIITVEHLGKRYGLPPYPTPRYLLSKLFGRNPAPPGANTPWALRDISFHLNHGETLGILGRNGAGKSTLLKILAGITPLTTGKITVEGRIFPMIELGAGVHPELTGRENARLLGVVMGLTQKESDAQLTRIEEFAELGEWFDRPVRTYSSGMHARLSFAVAVHIRSDILLLDEIFGVGDLSFFNKSMRAMEEMRSSGKGMLFVSHSLGHVRRICDRVIVIEKGAVVFDGPTEEGIGFYEELVLRTQKSTAAINFDQFDFAGIHLDAVTLHSESGAEIKKIKIGESARLRIRMHLEKPLTNFAMHVVIQNIESINVVWSLYELDHLDAGMQEFEVVWHGLRLKGGNYSVRIDINEGMFNVRAFRSTRALEFRFEADPVNQGLYLPETSIRHLDGSEVNKCAG